MNIDKMEGKELAIAVAERVMGWKKVSWLGEYDWRDGDGEQPYSFSAWKPSTDIAAAWLVEERIAELELIEEYCMALESLLFDANWEEESINVVWLTIHATPEDRCRAALMATETENR